MTAFKPHLSFIDIAHTIMIVDATFCHTMHCCTTVGFRSWQNLSVFSMFSIPNISLSERGHCHFNIICENSGYLMLTDVTSTILQECKADCVTVSERECPSAEGIGVRSKEC